MIKPTSTVIAASALALVFVLAGGANRAGALTPPPVAENRAGDPALGGAIAKERCSGCHAVGADGVSSHAGAPAFRDLSRTYPVESLAEAFAEGIVVGHSQMPEFELTQSEIKDLLAYLESIQSSASAER